MTGPSLRAATAEDLPAVLGLVRSASLPDDIEPHFGSFLVADRGGVIVGAVGLELVGDDRALLRSLVVAPDYRSAGAGTSLAEAAIPDFALSDLESAERARGGASATRRARRP